jgi:prophage regulatory protein
MSGRKFEVLRLPAIKKATGYSGSQICEMIREGRFPKPIKLGARAVGWPEPEIAKWQAEGVAERVGSDPAPIDALSRQSPERDGRESRLRPPKGDR